MTRSVVRVTVSMLVAVALAACPPAPKNGKGGGGGSINADACGTINTSKVGRKLYAFLQASAELDNASFEMESSVKDACVKMAKELGSTTKGTTKEVCDAALKALNDNLEISVSTESRLVTKTEPAVCTTDVDFSASFVAECEASASADVDVRCEGSCSGTCEGACDGTCEGDNNGGACDGVCDGTCDGRCSGGCEGYADVHASVECEASAEVHASVHTTCTEPKVVVVREDVTVVDDSKFQAAMAAIDAGLPQLLQVGAKAKLVLKAIGEWVTTGAKLVKAGGQLIDEVGDKALCVGAQLGAVVAAAADIQARVDVSIEVSASFSASAGAQAQ
jgi:hypothetical protein